MNAAASIADSLDGLRLNFALQAGILRLLSRQEHLNKINVFPVPDGDTGTNLALTVNAVLGSLRKWPDRHAGKTLTRVADAALDGARGNSGAILAQFFLGLWPSLQGLQARGARSQHAQELQLLRRLPVWPPRGQRAPALRRRFLGAEALAQLGSCRQERRGLQQAVQGFRALR